MHQCGKSVKTKIPKVLEANYYVCKNLEKLVGALFCPPPPPSFPLRPSPSSWIGLRITIFFLIFLINSLCNKRTDISHLCETIGKALKSVFLCKYNCQKILENLKLISLHFVSIKSFMLVKNLSTFPCIFSAKSYPLSSFQEVYS